MQKKLICMPLTYWSFAIYFHCVYLIVRRNQRMVALLQFTGVYLMVGGNQLMVALLQFTGVYLIVGRNQLGVAFLQFTAVYLIVGRNQLGVALLQFTGVYLMVGRNQVGVALLQITGVSSNILLFHNTEKVDCLHICLLWRGRMTTHFSEAGRKKDMWRTETRSKGQ